MMSHARNIIFSKGLSGLLIVFFLVLSGCQQSAKKSTPARTDLDDSYVGPLTEQDLQHSDSTKIWFAPAYRDFTIPQPTLDTLKKYIRDYKIVVFMGTWCPDSHREIPKFYKILDKTHYDKSKLEVYALDDYKMSQAGYEKGYDISNIPTIIFYKDGKEVNRFVEYARENLSGDLAKIVSGKPYKNVYAN